MVNKQMKYTFITKPTHHFQTGVQLLPVIFEKNDSILEVYIKCDTPSSITIFKDTIKEAVESGFKLDDILDLFTISHMVTPQYCYFEKPRHFHSFYELPLSLIAAFE